MKMSGTYRIEAPRDKVWAGLNDAEILKQSIPGCQSLEKQSDTELAATVKAKVGPVSATFNGQVTLSDIKAPESYRIEGQGKGGAAGFAKGGANVRLEEDGGVTVLHYEADAQVGGKLAQIGSRLVQGTAKKYADEFFGNFANAMGVAGGEAVEAEKVEPAAERPAEPTPEEQAEMATAAMRGAAPGHAAPEGPTAPTPEQARGLPGGETERPGLKPSVWITVLVVILVVLILIAVL
jgi:carbon monoxide dehydrogenase subunit G